MRKEWGNNDGKMKKHPSLRNDESGIKQKKNSFNIMCDVKSCSNPYEPVGEKTLEKFHASERCRYGKDLKLTCTES